LKLNEIKVRSEKALNDKDIPQLLAFAEGTTTNGKTILRFKRGAFYPNLPILPVFLKYWGPFFSPHYDLLPINLHMLLITSQLITTLTVYELPVVYPTEYMYENGPSLLQRHGRKLSGVVQERDCRIYAEVLRDIYATVFKLPKSDLNYKQKKDIYRILFKPVKNQ
jgi:hypothetical protein